MNKNLHLTGFEPFGESQINPSEQVVARLDGCEIGPFTVKSAILPVDYLQAPKALFSLLDDLHPDAVICLGEAGGRARISIERVAVNLLDFRIADNSGAVVEDEPVVPGGPAAYFSTLPVKPILKSLLEAGIPAELSQTAGAYLCNQVMYTLLHHLSETGRAIPAGFIHLPCLPEQAAALSAAGKGSIPSMALETMVMGIEAAIREIGK